MNKFAIAVVFLVLAIMGHAQKGHAQDVPVLTPGLTTGQCVKSTNTSEIGDAPCPGRVMVLPVASSYSLTNTECGSVVLGPGAGATGPAFVTMPSSPPANCEFTFRPDTNGFYIDFNGKTALLPGDQNIVTQWTIPTAPAFRTHNPSVSLQYNNSYWEESNVSSSIYEMTVRPANAAQIAQGQVYFNWNSSALRFQLCWSGGPGGLIVDGVMTQIPSDCLTLAQSATTSSMLNYFYAVHDDADDITVGGVLSNVSGNIRLTVSDARGNVGDTILVACDNIAGAIQTNVADAATVVDSTHLDLLHTSSSGLGTYTGGGNCRVTRLDAELKGHSTGGQGIQVKSDDSHYTLVGMCNIGASHSVSDTSSERDCASWYNRGVKTCINKFTADRATNLTSYTEVFPEIRCGFVTWGTGDPTGASDLSWSISGMMKNGTSGDGAAVTAGFDTTSMQETEESAYTNSSLAASGAPASVKGSKTGLLEGLHFITLLGKAITGGTATYFGSVPHTTLEIRIPQ